MTPPNYEPTGFAATELQLPLGRTAEVGRVATAHHALAFRVHAPNLAPEGAAALVNDTYPSQSQSTDSSSQANTPALPAAPRPKAPSLPSTSRAATNHGSSQDLPASQDLDNPLPDLSQTTQDMEDLEAAEGGALTVTCTCGSVHADPLMLVCAHCGTSQHAACYKILLQAEVRT